MSGLVEFCDRNNIQYQPARILVIRDSDTNKVKNKAPIKYKELNEFPKNIDFTGGMSKGKYYERKPDQVFTERKKLINNYPHLCIDTCYIHQVDIDFTEDKYDTYSDESKKFVEDLCKIAPYFKSMTKKHGKHIFIKTKKPLTDLGYSGKPVLIYEDIELLSGMWSYADKLQLVENADLEIPEFPIEDFIKDKVKLTKSKKIKKIKLKIKENNIKMEDDLVLNEDWSNEKKCIYELTNIIHDEYFTEYHYWSKIIWSLANYENLDNPEENLLDIAHHFSKKCKAKYDPDAVDKLFYNTHAGSTIGTFYYYVKKCDVEKYLSIRCKYFLLGKDLIYLTTDDFLADVFLDNQGINYVVKTLEGKLWLYTYNGNVWEQDSNSHHKLNCKIRGEIRPFLYEFLNAIQKKYNDEIAALDPQEDRKAIEFLEKAKAADMKMVQALIIQICNAGKVKGIAEVVLQKLACRDFEAVEFDTNGYIFTFKNKCFCLKTFQEIKTNREDYILTTTGYKYEESTDKSKKELDELLDKIFPDEEVKDHYIKVMCSALYGVRLEKFFIANGNGGNGKGVINELLGDTLGNYYYKGNSESFTKPLKEGNNPQIANMHNKRLVIIQEIESDNKRLNGTVIKELTGGNKINTRANYSNVTQISILATFILECNKKSKIDGRIDESYLRRLDDIPFVSTFTNDDRLLNSGLDKVFQANTYYKSDEFRLKFKLTLFNYLLDYMKNYKKETNKLITEGWKSPQIVLDRTAEYLESSDDVKEWFNTKYQHKANEYKNIKEKVENRCFVECKHIYQLYKESQYYSLLTKKQRREQNLKWFYSYMKENINFKVWYKEKYTLEKKTYRNILLDHEEIDFPEDLS